MTRTATGSAKGRRPVLVPSLVTSDLTRSGLNGTDTKALRIESLTSAETGEETGGKYRSRASYRLPYFDLDGNPTTFYRLKFLGDCSPTELIDGKPLKYWQPPKSQPHVYFPPYIKWRDVLADPTYDLYLVEGEKKAAAGSKLLQRAVVGLGGVWSFGSRKTGVAVVPELVPFLLRADRRVIIVYDTDPVENTDVLAAREALAAAIWQHGSVPLVLNLPLVDGEKTGLDDFLVKKGVKAFDELVPVASDYAAALSEVNEDLAYIQAQHAIYHLKTGAMFDRPQRLTQLAYAHRKLLTIDRAGKPVEKNIVSEWLTWPGRRTHVAITYEPGAPTITEKNELNVWRGWGVEPKRGPVTPFLDLLDRFFDGAASEHRRWFLQWLAYPIQHPGTKLTTAVVLFSRDTGTGKTLLGETLGRVYGENYTVLNAENLHSPFNTWARHKQFVLGEELTGSERRADAERLKLLVTQQRVMINAKFQPTYELPDRCNYMLTTNHADALNLDVYDRRFFVHEVLASKLPASVYRPYDKWYRSEPGAAAMFYYLQNSVDVSDFDPYGAAPNTKAKSEMQLLSDLPVDFSLKELLEAPERNLAVGGKPVERDLFTPKELTLMLDPDGKKKFTEHAVAKALRRAGLRQLEVTRVTSGPVRLYAVRNVDHWLRASHAERACHYDGQALVKSRREPEPPKPATKKRRKKK